MLIAEVIVPGGILGLIGGLLMLIGTVFSYIEFGLNGGGLALLAAALLSAIAFSIEFLILRKTKMGRRLFLSSEVTSQASLFSDDAKKWIGSEALAISALAPTGYVMIDDQRFEAFSQSGFTESGQRLRVIGADNFRLIVTNASS